MVLSQWSLTTRKWLESNIVSASLFNQLKKDDIPSAFYHGTSSIHGIRVGDKILPPNSTSNITEDRKKNRDVIFLTPDAKYAGIYAGRSKRIFGGERQILRVIPLGVELFKKENGINIYTAEGGFVVDVLATMVSNHSSR